MKLKPEKYYNNVNNTIKKFFIKVISLMFINEISYADDKSGDVAYAGSAILIIVLFIIIFSILMGGNGDD